MNCILIKCNNVCCYRNAKAWIFSSICCQENLDRSCQALLKTGSLEQLSLTLTLSGSLSSGLRRLRNTFRLMSLSFRCVSHYYLSTYSVLACHVLVYWFETVTFSCRSESRLMHITWCLAGKRLRSWNMEPGQYEAKSLNFWQNSSQRFLSWTLIHTLLLIQQRFEQGFYSSWSRDVIVPLLCKFL